MLNKRIINLVFLVAASLTLVSAPAAAVVIEWSLGLSLFSTGGTASGSFLWDNATDDVIGWQLDVTGGAPFTNFTYSDTGAGEFVSIETSPDRLRFNAPGRQLTLGISLLDLDVAATGVLLPELFEFVSPNNTRFSLSDGRGLLNGAEVIPAPEPTTLSLLGLGLLGLGAARRRKKRSA